MANDFHIHLRCQTWPPMPKPGFNCLPERYRRVEAPQQYKVGISKQLRELREKLKNHYKK